MTDRYKAKIITAELKKTVLHTFLVKTKRKHESEVEDLPELTLPCFLGFPWPWCCGSYVIIFNNNNNNAHFRV